MGGEKNTLRGAQSTNWLHMWLTRITRITDKRVFVLLFVFIPLLAMRQTLKQRLRLVYVATSVARVVAARCLYHVNSVRSGHVLKKNLFA